VGRFTAVLRALVPSLAGTAAMPYRTFAVYNIARAVLWATGFVLLGYAAGRAYRTAERIAGQAGLALLGRSSSALLRRCSSAVAAAPGSRPHLHRTSVTDRRSDCWVRDGSLASDA
jgi:hypothetical protein